MGTPAAKILAFLKVGLTSIFLNKIKSSIRVRHDHSQTPEFPLSAEQHHTPMIDR